MSWIVEQILSLFDAVLTCYVLKAFINEFRIEVKKDLLVIITYYSIVFIRLLHFDNLNDSVIMLVTSILSISVAGVFAYKLFRKSIYASVVASLLTVVFLILRQVAGLLLLNFVISRVFELELNSTAADNIAQVIYMSISCYVVHKYNRQMYRVLRSCCNYAVVCMKGIRGFAKITLTGVAVVMALSVDAVFMLKYGTYSEESLILNFILAVVLTLVILVHYESKINNCKVREAEQRALRLEEQNKMNSIHTEFVQSMNSFGHSYNNLTQVISFFVNSEDVDIHDVREVMKDILDWSADNKISYRLKYASLPDAVVSALLSLKLEYATKLGVILDVKHTGSSSVKCNKKILIDIIDVTVKNAIEAAFYAEDKIVSIDMVFGEDKFRFRVSNNYQSNSEGVTVKYGMSHGIGLDSITNLSGSGVNVDYEDYDNKFTITCIVDNLIAGCI